MNKSETEIKDQEYIEKISSRKNVILMGDSLEDIGMVDNMKVNEIIKIGFLNENIKERLELYKEKYDVVISNDGTMEYPDKILNNILN